MAMQARSQSKMCERARRGASPRKCYWETCRAVVKRLPRVARPAPGSELEDAAMQFLAEKAHLDDNVRAPRESAYTACYASGVAVERWKDGCLGAVSLTSDDGRWSAIDMHSGIAALFTRHGINGTFFLPTKRVLERDARYLAALRALKMAGHEIGSHTHTHRNLAEASIAEVQREIATAAMWLAHWFGPEAVFSFAYPYGQGVMSKNITAMVQKYHRAHRSTAAFVSHHAATHSALPCYFWGTSTEAQHASWWVRMGVRTRGWTIEGLHGMVSAELERGYEPVDSRRLAAHLEELNAMRAQRFVWIDTIQNIVRYAIRRDSITRLETHDRVIVLESLEGELMAMRFGAVMEMEEHDGGPVCLSIPVARLWGDADGWDAEFIKQWECAVIGSSRGDCAIVRRVIPPDGVSAVSIGMVTHTESGRVLVLPEPAECMREEMLVIITAHPTEHVSTLSIVLTSPTVDDDAAMRLLFSEPLHRSDDG